MSPSQMNAVIALYGLAYLSAPVAYALPRGGSTFTKQQKHNRKQKLKASNRSKKRNRS